MNISLSAFAPKNLASRDGFGSPTPRKPAHLLLRLNMVLTYEIPPEFRGGVDYLFKTDIRHRVGPEFIGSRSCVRMTFTAENPPAQGQ